MAVEDSSVNIDGGSTDFSNSNSYNPLTDSFYSSLNDLEYYDSNFNTSNSKNIKANTLKYSSVAKSANANLTVSPSASSYKYGSDAKLNIHLFDGQTPLSGLVLVTVDNEVHPVNVTNGSAILIISGLENNTYPVLARFVGNDDYESVIYEDAVIVINKSRKVTGNASITEINVYGDDIILTVENLSDVDGKMISCYGCYQLSGPVNPYSLFAVKKGAATVHISGIPVGNYSAYVVFGNNMGGTYELPNFILNFSVVKAKPVLSMECEDIYYGQDANINIALVDNRGYPIYVTDTNSTLPVIEFECGDFRENITLSYGLGSANIKGLSVGTYTAIARFSSSYLYEEANFNLSFKVIKANVNVDVQVDNISYGENAVINICLRDDMNNDLNGTVRVGFESFSENVLIENGKGILSIENLDIGNYSCIAVFKSTDSYEGETCSFDFNVDKGNIVITCALFLDNLIRPLGEKSDDYILFTVKDNALNVLTNKVISIKINDLICEYITDSKGQFKLRHYFEDKTVYNITAEFSGDNYYKEFSKNINISVNRPYLDLIVTNNVFKAKHKNKVLTASLKLSNGKAVSGKVLRFTLNGKTYLGKTNSKGLAKVKITLSKKGTYKFTVKFLGNKLYSAISNSGKLVLK